MEPFISVYQGYLFVKDALLNESGMENHPLTPMKDANLRRLMAAQSVHSVGHVPAAAVFDGAAAIVDKLEDEHAAGHRMIVVDALRDADLMQIGAAASHALQRPHGRPQRRSLPIRKLKRPVPSPRRGGRRTCRSPQTHRSL